MRGGGGSGGAAIPQQPAAGQEEEAEERPEQPPPHAPLTAAPWRTRRPRPRHRRQPAPRRAARPAHRHLPANGAGLAAAAPRPLPYSQSKTQTSFPPTSGSRPAVIQLGQLRRTPGERAEHQANHSPSGGEPRPQGECHSATWATPLSPMSSEHRATPSHPRPAASPRKGQEGDPDLPPRAPSGRDPPAQAGPQQQLQAPGRT